MEVNPQTYLYPFCMWDESLAAPDRGVGRNAEFPKTSVMRSIVQNQSRITHSIHERSDFGRSGNFAELVGFTLAQTDMEFRR